MSLDVLSKRKNGNNETLKMKINDNYVVCTVHIYRATLQLGKTVCTDPVSQTTPRHSHYSRKMVMFVVTAM